MYSEVKIDVVTAVKITYLTASKGKLKALRMRSEAASEARNGVVG